MTHDALLINNYFIDFAQSSFNNCQANQVKWYGVSKQPFISLHLSQADFKQICDGFSKQLQQVEPVMNLPAKI